jgi:tetratricopeptide (TPR) repeat protein
VPAPEALLEATRDVLTLARERFAVRDYHGAVLLLSEAARDRPLYADALNLLGLSLAMIDRTQDALQAFDDALDRNPRYIEALLNRAVLLTQLGRHDEARDAYARAEELGRPDESGFPAVVANRLANSHAVLGDEYRAAGALDEAIAQYRRALALRPGFSDIRLKLARTLLEHGDYHEAGGTIDHALRERPDWLDAMLIRGLAFYLQGDLDEAGRMWERASARHPEEPRLEIYRSMLARRRGGPS